MPEQQPIATEILTDEQMAQPGVLEAFIEELRERGSLAVAYKKEMDEATTEVKRNHFYKKLVANNEQAVDIIAAIERINAARSRIANTTPDSAP